MLACIPDRCLGQGAERQPKLGGMVKLLTKYSNYLLKPCAELCGELNAHAVVHRSTGRCAKLDGDLQPTRIGCRQAGGLRKACLHASPSQGGRRLQCPSTSSQRLATPPPRSTVSLFPCMAASSLSRAFRAQFLQFAHPAVMRTKDKPHADIR